MSRLMILDVVGGIQGWLINGALVALAVGLIVVGRLGERAGMPAGWRWLSLVLATLSLVGVLLSFFDVYPLDALLVLAGVLAPAWALWLSGRASNLWPDSTVVSIPAA
jgi:MFS family permease